MQRQLEIAWMIAAAIGITAVAVVGFQYLPHKTEVSQPAEPPAKEKQPQEEKRAQENKQAQRWVCSHTTRQTVLILTEVSGAFRASMDQCDEWKLKEP